MAAAKVSGREVKRSLFYKKAPQKIFVLGAWAFSPARA
jgi:hypothetical protein